jgi:hypothetical protein
VRLGTCNICGKYGSVQRNHCIIHRSKGWEKWLDVPENTEDVCMGCHIYPAHTHWHKVDFWRQQVERGYDMSAWWDSLPEKLTIGRKKPV